MPTVVITGASRGIGLEFARQYAQDGWTVVAGAREPAASPGLQTLVRTSPSVRPVTLDVSESRSVEAFSAGIDGPVDLLINNAGVAGPATQSLEDVEASDWHAAFAINVVGPLLVTRALLPAIKAGDRKRIALITSRVGSIALSSGGRYAYRTTKAAANMLAKTLAADLAPAGIEVVALHPGWVRTDMGGAQAPVGPADSVAGMRRILDGAAQELSGRFVDFEGNELAW